MIDKKTDYIGKGNPNYRGGHISESGYHHTCIQGKNKRTHRMVMEEALGRPLLAGEIVHHKNGDRLDNRPENLEVMSQSEHNRVHGFANRARTMQKLSAKTRPWGGPLPSNKSGFRGVYWHKRDKRWIAHIRISGKQKSLGRFSTPEETAAAYEKALVGHYGPRPEAIMKAVSKETEHD